MKSKLKVALYVLVLLTIFLIGIMIGINIGTYAVIEKTASALSGSTFIINFNETRMIEEMNKTLVPQMKEIANKYLEEQFSGDKK